jgi:hypothetical protein
LLVKIAAGMLAAFSLRAELLPVGWWQFFLCFSLELFENMLYICGIKPQILCV